MIRNKISLFLTTCLIALLTCMATSDRAVASLVASDNASDPAYNTSWSTGTNGGTGFGSWTVSNAAGSGSGGGFIAAGTSIDVSGEAFGMFGNGGGTGQAVRSFTGGDLAVGQTFSIDMDNGTFIDSGTRVGFSLQNSSGDDLFEFFFEGDDIAYSVNKLAGVTLTSTGFTTAGLSLDFSLTDSDSFSFTINGSEIVTGDLLANADQGIEGLRLFTNAGPGGDRDAFFNSISISAVPEVTAALALPLLMGSVFGIRSLRRRRTA